MSYNMPYEADMTAGPDGAMTAWRGLGQAVVRGTVEVAHFFVTGASCAAIVILLM